MFSHRLSLPSRHRVQRPHQRDGLTATRSPILSPAALPAISIDLAGDFVAEHQRRRHHEIPGAGMAEVMHVRAANAAGAEADAHHARREAVERPLDHAQVFRAEQSCSQSHRCHFASPIYFGNHSVSSGM